MQWKRTSVLAVAAICLLMVGSMAMAGKFNKTVNVGDDAPAWSDLKGCDGEAYSLKDLVDANKATVVVFTCNTCPVAVACEERFIELQKDYEDKGVQLVAISVQDDLSDMKDRAMSRGFNFPYLLDETQQSARDFGASRTPELFVVDGKGKIVYMGLMDDSPLNAAKVKETYLRDALDAVLAGKTPEVAETKAQGCGIRYE
ncbi:MAG: thioredoxin family protein [Pirellulales bacterium]|nr:thioredoxin family protein [Planctomycetales bacterium]